MKSLDSSPGEVTVHQMGISLPLASLLRVTQEEWLGCFLDELRKRRRRAEVPFSALEWEDREEGLSPLEAIPDPEPLPEEMTERSELNCWLHAAIVSLPPKFRSIVHLRYFRQLTFSEIGRTLKMPEPTVKTYFYRSLPRFLRRALAGNVHFASVS